MQNEWVIPYLPHATQTPFHLDRYRERFRLLSGGTGSGKTIAGAFEMIDYLIENPGAVGYIFEPTYPMVKKNLIKQSFEELLGTPIDSNYFVETYNRTDNFIQFRNGSRLWFGSLEAPEMAEGANIDLVMVDEARLIRRFGEAWMSVQRRLRGSVPGRFWNGAYVTTTPNAPGSDLHKFFEDPETRDPESKVYRMALYDNPHLTEQYVRSIERKHVGSYAEAFIYGRFTKVGFGSFAFDVTKHELDKIDMSIIQHVGFGVDFGWTEPLAIVAVGYDGDFRAYILDEFYQSQAKNETMIQAARDMVEKWGEGNFYCDPSDPRSIEELRRGTGFIVRKAQSGTADKFSRDDSIRELGSRFLDAGDGRPRIFVSEHCVKWIGEVMAFDAERKENDHLVDATRYALMNTSDMLPLDVGTGYVPGWP